MMLTNEDQLNELRKAVTAALMEFIDVFKQGETAFVKLDRAYEFTHSRADLALAAEYKKLGKDGSNALNGAIKALVEIRNSLYHITADDDDLFDKVMDVSEKFSDEMDSFNKLNAEMQQKAAAAYEKWKKDKDNPFLP